MHVTGLDPDPWDAGAIAAILPELADCRVSTGTKPLAEFSRDEMIALPRRRLLPDPQGRSCARPRQQLVTRRGPG